MIADKILWRKPSYSLVEKVEMWNHHVETERTHGHRTSASASPCPWPRHYLSTAAAVGRERACVRPPPGHTWPWRLCHPSIHPRERRARRSRRSVERAPRQNSPRSVQGRTREFGTDHCIGGSVINPTETVFTPARCTRSPSSREGRLKPALSVVRSKHAN